MSNVSESDKLKTTLQGFRDPEKCRETVERIHKFRFPGQKLRFMEVCGTHTVAIFRHGLRELLPPEIELVSGPGCPVCVTPVGYFDQAVALAARPEVIVATFGDLMRVPGSVETLQDARARGGDIRIIYSPLDALNLAKTNPDRIIVFLAVGFETTAPAVAAAAIQARRENIGNFSMLSAHKLIPPALKALVLGDVKVDGFILPGHVSAIIGAEPYEFLSRELGIPAVVAGFEPLDILQTVLMLAEMINEKSPAVKIQYSRIVRAQGNTQALKIMNRVFEAADSCWRGLGTIPQSGLVPREEYRGLDAMARMPLDLPEPIEPVGCLCGEVLKGTRLPTLCPLFDKTCTPLHPVGACMVSTEGACAAYYKYGRG